MDVTRTVLPLMEGPAPAVTAAVHRPAEPRAPGVLLTHGAGGNLDGAGLIALAEVFAGLGHPVVRCNLPYREVGRRTPPRAEHAVRRFMAVVASARETVGADAAWAQTPWVVGGKSYGGRVASLAVAEGLAATGLVFYGYPLHPPGKPDRLRVDHWPDIGVPSLFLQGTRDSFCDLDLLRPSLRKLPRRATLEVVEGGDHSLEVTAKASPDGRRRAAPEVIHSLAPAIARWMGSILTDPV